MYSQQPDLAMMPAADIRHEMTLRELAETEEQIRVHGQLLFDNAIKMSLKDNSGGEQDGYDDGDVDEGRYEGRIARDACI
jgi:hypothetical protein